MLLFRFHDQSMVSFLSTSLKYFILSTYLLSFKYLNICNYLLGNYMISQSHHTLQYTSLLFALFVLNCDTISQTHCHHEMNMWFLKYKYNSLEILIFMFHALVKMIFLTNAKRNNSHGQSTRTEMQAKSVVTHSEKKKFLKSENKCHIVL